MRGNGGVWSAVKAVSGETAQRFGRKKTRSIQITGASCLGNGFVALGKLLLGFYSLNFYVCAGGFYTLGMVAAKVCALTGLAKGKTAWQQARRYRLSGVILIAASTAYIVDSIYFLLYPRESRYDEIVGITIAAFTFLELGLNLRGVIIERKNKTPLFHALKTINLASALICLVLTQTALLSFGQTGTEYAVWNGAMGICMGGLAVMLGVMMLRRIKRIQQKEEEADAAYSGGGR